MNPHVTEWYLGIDGGGTKTCAAAACRERGGLRQVAEIEVGGSNPLAAGVEAACAAIEEAVSRLLRQHPQLAAQQCRGVCLALAGAGREPQSTAIREWAGRQPWGRNVRVVNDIEVLLAAGLKGEPVRQRDVGVALIAGTGSMAWGRDAGGRTARCGGWGHLLGDEGSGYAIAAAALRLIGQMQDGRREVDPILVDSALRWAESSSWDELIGKIYGAAEPKRFIASFAEPVLRLESAAPAVERIRRQAADSLAELVATVAKTLDLPRYRLACGGGLLVGCPALMELLEHTLSQTSRPPGEVFLVGRPVEGALRLAVSS
jgi:N-acetylglucosamine kinase-like BadF-type ATPase